MILSTLYIEAGTKGRVSEIKIRIGGGSDETVTEMAARGFLWKSNKEFTKYTLTRVFRIYNATNFPVFII